MITALKIILLLLICTFITTNAQNYSKAIEDNSYFNEEAYNQEYRIVQHIFNAYHFPTPDKNIAFSFTQEWPIFGQAHQLSYTIAYGGTSFSNGIGDVLINYRYQLTGHDDFITSSPRISLVLPTGDEARGFGNGKVGVQFNLPLSKRLSEAFAAHFNMGYALIPNAEVDLTQFNLHMTGGPVTKENVHSFSVGASLIWLASYNLNFMLEYLLTRSNDSYPYDQYATEHIINPGLRFAIDVNNLQIVPGISVPVRFDKDISTAGIFTYISFEHPF